MKNKKQFKSINAIENGNTIDFWEWYYKGRFKENVALYSSGKKDFLSELKKHYEQLSKYRQVSMDNLKHWNMTYRMSGEALLNQLHAIENIFNEYKHGLQ